MKKGTTTYENIHLHRFDMCHFYLAGQGDTLKLH